MQTQIEINKRQRELRKLNNNIWSKKYEKTHNGFLMRLYRNMTSRVIGIQKKKCHLYKGLSILSKQDFYNWAKSELFYKMFNEWEKSNYDRKLTPTVNRINSDIGYEIGNIEWLTHSENSRLGALSIKRGLISQNL